MVASAIRFLAYVFEVYGPQALSGGWGARVTGLGLWFLVGINRGYAVLGKSRV